MKLTRILPILTGLQARAQDRQRKFAESGCLDVAEFVNGGLKDSMDTANQIEAIYRAEHVRLMELPEEPEWPEESPDDIRERKEAQAGDREHDRRAAEERH